MIDNTIFSKKLLLVALKDTVVFPQSIISIYVNSENSKKGVKKAFETNKLVFLSCLKEGIEEDSNKVYKVGCVGLIMRIKQTRDKRLKVLIQGLRKAQIEKMEGDTVHLNYFPENKEALSEKQKLFIENIKQLLDQLFELKNLLSQDLLAVLKSVKDPIQFCNMLIHNLDIKTAELQKFLEIESLDEKLVVTQKILQDSIEMSALQGRLKKIIKSSSHPLLPPYDTPPPFSPQYKKQDAREYQENLSKKNLPEQAKKEAFKQLNRLEKMHAESSEASMVRNYLDWILELPWNETSKDNLSLENAQKVLNEDHLGIDKVKERILEFLAVCNLKPKSLKGPILCFAGPPGVGKTSLGKSIAKALGKSYHRISLGGLIDEAEIRGHRRTYVGAMPGKIIQALKMCQTRNPVIVLDEIDKLCSNFKGDPSSALLEVLDPEQNHSFKDHYLNLDFDLSQVFFIATANVIHNIPPALKDRLEVISLSGYTLEEKKQITKRHLLSKELKNNGLPEKHIQLKDKALTFLIEHYTKEAGLRNLSRQLAGICRKTAKKFVLGDNKSFTLDQKQVMEMLGSPHFHKDDVFKKPEVGLVTGLAWTEVGGETLPIEVIRIKSQKPGLILTGKLGEVMKESAQASLSYIKSYVQKLNLKQIDLDKHEIHIHIPGGAVPKDGPSAGVALASSLLSLITEVPAKNDVAMTGEITLSGRVLPVGGVKEKILAAFNNKIKTVILPQKNLKDLDEVPKEVKEKMKFLFVSDLSEVFKEVLLYQPPERNQILEEGYLGPKDMGDVA